VTVDGSRLNFLGKNEPFSLTNLFTRNTNVGFQSLAITLETRTKEQIQKWTQK